MGSSFEALCLALVEVELDRGDRVAVGVDRGMAQLGRDQRLEVVGEDVLEHLSLGVNAVPGHAEDIGQVALEQPVVADDLEGDPPAVLGQADAAVGDVTDQPELVKALEHGRDRTGCDAQALGQCIG